MPVKSADLIGVGLRQPHYQQVIQQRPHIGWFEVHSENFFHYGAAAETLLSIRQHYPISLHGVGLSLGSAAGISKKHLKALKHLISDLQPCLISEHLSWSTVAGVYMPDLLPVPYTDEALEIFDRNISFTQDFLKRSILIENPSSYIEYKTSNQQEVDFLVTLCQRTGAKILLDVNNVFVSCSNHHWDPKQYIQAIPKNLVKEIHLAGHSHKTLASNQTLLVDTHDQYVCEAVWDLYDYTLQRFGSTPTLLEWDAKLPNLDQLILEASKALDYLPTTQNAYVCP